MEHSCKTACTGKTDATEQIERVSPAHSTSMIEDVSPHCCEYTIGCPLSEKLKGLGMTCKDSHHDHTEEKTHAVDEVTNGLVAKTNRTPEATKNGTPEATANGVPEAITETTTNKVPEAITEATTNGAPEAANGSNDNVTHVEDMPDGNRHGGVFSTSKRTKIPEAEGPGFAKGFSTDLDEISNNGEQANTENSNVTEVEQPEQLASTPKVVVVIGATGQQGGGVLEALKSDARFEVKALVRNRESEKAKALADVELVVGDLNDTDSLKQAFHDVFGVFGVTNYWEDLDMEKEITQGKNLVDACKAANVKFLVYSGLEDVQSLLGKPCRHFDGKAQVEKYIKEQEIPSCVVRYPCYMENFLTFFKLIKEDDETYASDIPTGDRPFYLIPVREAGKCIREIFINYEEFLHTVVLLASDDQPLSNYMKILSNHFEKKFKVKETTCEEYAQLDKPGASELAVMFEFMRSDKFERDVLRTRKLYLDISDFNTWVVLNMDKIQAVL